MRDITLENLFLRIAITFFSWLLVLVLFAILGWFNLAAVIIISAIAIGLLIFSLIYSTKKLKIKKPEVVVLLIILGICIFVGLWHHDYLLGRDPVSYFTASLQITETGSLSFTDEIGRSFHGLSQIGEDTFTSQFLPGYSVYLAVWYLLFGIGGLFWANTLLLALALLAIYFVAKKLSTHAGGLIAILLTATFYSVIWFERRWTSENLLMLTIFSAVACFVYGVRKQSLVWLLFGLFPAVFSLLIRGEGLLYIFAYIVALIIVLLWWRKQFNFKTKAWALLILPITTFSVFQIYTMKLGSGYVFEQGQSIFNAIGSLFGKPEVILGMIAVLALVFVLLLIRYIAKTRFNSNFSFWKLYVGLLGLGILITEIGFYIWSHSDQVFIKWDFYRSQYVLEALSYYLLAIFFIIIFIGLYKRLWSKLTYLVILLTAPALVFVLDPYIALDHPWFMRRYVAILVPIVFILVAITIARLNLKKKTAILVAIILIGINLAVASPVLFFSENKGINKQISSLAQKFDDQDLILMTPGWRWQQWAYYLHFYENRNFLPSTEGFEGENKQELLDIINSSDSIYVLSDKKFGHHPWFDDKDLEFVENIILEYPMMTRPLWGQAGLLEKSDGEVDLFQWHKNLEQLPPDEIVQKKIELQLFKIKK